MKRTVLLVASLFVLISPSLGVVGENTSDSQPGITSLGSSSGATTAVGPNGTKYTAKVSMEGRTQNKTNDTIRSETISSSKVNFNGTIQASTPCHAIEHDVNEAEQTYTINIKTIEDSSNNQLCTQVITGINYNAEFEAETGFTLEVMHNGEKIETLQTVSDKQNKTQKQQKSIIQKLLNFLGI